MLLFDAEIDAFDNKSSVFDQRRKGDSTYF